MISLSVVAPEENLKKVEEKQDVSRRGIHFINTAYCLICYFLTKSKQEAGLFFCFVFLICHLRVFFPPRRQVFTPFS